MHPFRQSLVLSLFAAAAPIIPASAAADGLDLGAVMSSKDDGAAKPSLLAVGTGLSKALPFHANYSVETNSISELRPTGPANLPGSSGRTPEEAETPAVPTVVVVSKDAEADDDAGGTPPDAKAKVKAMEKDKPAVVRKRRAARRSSPVSGTVYEVPTNAIISNELSHSAKITRRLAGEP